MIRQLKKEAKVELRGKGKAKERTFSLQQILDIFGDIIDEVTQSAPATLHDDIVELIDDRSSEEEQVRFKVWLGKNLEFAIGVDINSQVSMECIIVFIRAGTQKADYRPSDKPQLKTFGMFLFVPLGHSFPCSNTT